MAKLARPPNSRGTIFRFSFFHNKSLLISVISHHLVNTNIMIYINEHEQLNQIEFTIEVRLQLKMKQAHRTNIERKL